MKLRYESEIPRSGRKGLESWRHPDNIHFEPVEARSESDGENACVKVEV